MSTELRRPESSTSGEAAAEVQNLQDALESKRVARKKFFWGGLVPGLGVVAYFAWTAVGAASATPSITLAVVFGCASVLVWRRVRRLSLEEREIEREIQNLAAPALDSG